MLVPRLFISIEKDAVENATEQADARRQIEDQLPRVQRLLREKRSKAGLSLNWLESNTHVIVRYYTNDVGRHKTRHRC